MYQRKTWKQIQYKPYRTHSYIHVNTNMKEKASSNYVPTISLYNLTNELRHDKTNKMAVRPATTQISLGIYPVWSESLLSAWRKTGSLAIHWAHSEDSDQTGRMPRLIWVTAGRTLTLLVLSCGGSNYNLQLQTCRIICHALYLYIYQISKSKPGDLQGLLFGPRQANLLLIAYASSEGSGEPAHSRSLARTSAARSYKQWVKRNLQTESQIHSPSEWLGMHSWNLSWRNARRHKFAWRGPFILMNL